MSRPPRRPPRPPPASCCITAPRFGQWNLAQRPALDATIFIVDGRRRGAPFAAQIAARSTLDAATDAADALLPLPRLGHALLARHDRHEHRPARIDFEICLGVEEGPLQHGVDVSSSGGTLRTSILTGESDLGSEDALAAAASAGGRNGALRDGRTLWAPGVATRRRRFQRLARRLLAVQRAPATGSRVFFSSASVSCCRSPLAPTAARARREPRLPTQGRSAPRPTELVSLRARPRRHPFLLGRSCRRVVLVKADTARGASSPPFPRPRLA